MLLLQIQLFSSQFVSFTPKNIITKEISYFEVIKSLRFLFSDNVKNRKDFTVLFTQDIT